MNPYRSFLPMIVLLSLAFNLYSQDVTVPDALPATKDEFIKSEKYVLDAINWLETTPIDQQHDQRVKLNAYLLAWLTNSPTVTIDFDARIVPLNKKNPDLLAAFMGGWTRYTLQNDYSKDQVQCNLAGLRDMIKVYNANLEHGIKKDKAMEKLIDLDTKGGLEQWVGDQLKKK